MPLVRHRREDRVISPSPTSNLISAIVEVTVGDRLSSLSASGTDLDCGEKETNRFLVDDCSSHLFTFVWSLKWQNLVLIVVLVDNDKTNFFSSLVTSHWWWVSFTFSSLECVKSRCNLEDHTSLDVYICVWCSLEDDSFSSIQPLKKEEMTTMWKSRKQQEAEVIDYHRLATIGRRFRRTVFRFVTLPTEQSLRPGQRWDKE